MAEQTDQVWYGLGIHYKPARTGLSPSDKQSENESESKPQNQRASFSASSQGEGLGERSVTKFYGVLLFVILIVKTQRNSTQSNSKATSVGVRHSSHVFHPTTPPRTNFSATSRLARELKFGTDTHLTNLIKIT